MQNSASKDADQLNSPASAGLPRLEAQTEEENATTDSRKLVKTQLNIRRLRTEKGTWHENKVDASIAKNLKTEHAIRQASRNAPQPLLAEAKVAFKAFEDYIGRPVDPRRHPTSVRESQLPWSLPASERTTQSTDRSETILMTITP